MKKKILLTIVWIIIILSAILGIKNLCSYAFGDKLKIKLESSSVFYIGSNIDALVSLDNNDLKPNSRVSYRFELLDANKKKVRKANYFVKTEASEKKEVSIELPEELETGKYTLHMKARKGLYASDLDFDVVIKPSIQNNVIISLDKGIYKPGDEINYRALIISKNDYIPVEKEVNICIYDGNENKVYSEKAKTSEFGIVSGKFQLANEVNSGSYKISVNLGGQEVSKIFNVNPYITPKYEVSILTDKENYNIGDEAEITVDCKYFFGEPVKNATVKGTVDSEEIMGLTNDEGKFVYHYKMNQPKTVSINLNVTDDSNYMIEQSKSIACKTDIFEIEILPEFGDLVTKVNNDIYILTKTTNGTPVKTYSRVSIGDVSKQLISDENGIGKVTFTSSELSSFLGGYSTEIRVEAKDMEGQIVNIAESFNFISNTNLIKTDKVKYEKGEDIEVELISSVDSDSNSVFVFKNNELIKTATFEGNSTKLNLEDITGLVDIYTRRGKSEYRYDYRDYDYTYNSNYSYKYNDGYSKKTVFIKPDKSLNIDINLGKDEYKPGDTLSAKFTTKDQSNNSVDTALLVSILDEAILSIENNDLSIDNIKLALEDIELSEGTTAADLYASVMNDDSEMLLMSALLKQSSKNPNIVTETSYDIEHDAKLAKAIGFLSLTAIVIIFYCMFRFPKFRNIVRKYIIPAINVLVITALIILVLEPTDLFYDIYDSLNDNILIMFLMVFVIAVVLYVLILYKVSDLIFKMIYETAIPIVMMIIYITAIVALNRSSSINILPTAIILLLAIFILLYDAAKKGNLKSKFWKVFYKIHVMLFRFIITALVASIFSAGSFAIATIIYIVLYIVIDKVRESSKKSSAEIAKDNKITINVTSAELIGMFVGIALILLLVGGVNQITRNFASVVDDSAAAPVTSSRPGGLESPSHRNGITFDSAESLDAITSSAEDRTGTSEEVQSMFSPFSSIKNFDKNDSKANEEYIEEVQVSEEIEDASFSEKTTKVRSIFLESLAFIPELVATNGNADLNVPISDNITTWSIQVVGNTKDGNIGYASNQFKVFQEYFIDFSVPANSVVGDKVSIPVTVYNYTENDINVELKVAENNWATIGNYEKNMIIPSKGTRMTYVPIEIIKEGTNTLRIESKSNGKSDIVEKNITVKINGLEVEKNISSGVITENYSMDILFDEKYIPGTENIKLRILPSPMAQNVDNIDAMLKLPTGCFEQTSSSLYPDILVLKYLQANKLDNDEIRNKALDYISKGYQKLLTYEVPGTKGGYSLYGRSPAEPVITAFGLMEFNELKEVYEVDENVINNMIEYLFDNQNSDGTFKYSSTYIGGASNIDKEAMNAYIIWAISEVCPDDARLNKSIKYLENLQYKNEDNYTLALIANVFANTNKDASNIIKILNENISATNNGAYIGSNTYDYYGCYGRYQDIQTTALTSLALSKLNKESKNNTELINYIISSKGSNSTWGTTQSTILALKAVNEFTANSDVSEQTLTFNFNNKTTTIDIKDDPLDIYETEFDNTSKENRLAIGMKKGKIIYEVIEQYYMDYADITPSKNIDLTYNMTTNTIVNGEVTQSIIIKPNVNVENGLLRINIPQGTSVIEDTLLKLKYDGTIEKYEYNYNTINVYFRSMKSGSSYSIDVKYRALYPEEITGGAIRFYDYYNPDIEAICPPSKLNVN